MQPFKIDRKSWHYKLNQKFLNERGDNIYYMRDNWEPRHNNFCAYWRVTMFRMIGASFVISGLCILLFGLGQLTFAYPWETFTVVSGILGFVAAIIALVAAVIFTQEYFEKRKEAKSDRQPSLFMQKYLTHKQKICPMVEYD